MQLKATAAATLATVTTAAAGVALLGATNGAATDERSAQACTGRFVAKSSKSLEAAMQNAAVRTLRKNPKCKKQWVRVDSIELLLDPPISEYKVTLVGSR